MTDKSMWRMSNTSSAPHAGGRERREYGQRMNVTLVEHPENDVDGDQGPARIKYG